MMAGGGNLSHAKHRMLPFHKRAPVSGAAKRAVLQAVARAKPARVSTTEWFATVREALRKR